MKRLRVFYCPTRSAGGSERSRPVLITRYGMEFRAPAASH